jgi:hypothetical protein
MAQRLCVETGIDEEFGVLVLKVGSIMPFPVRASNLSRTQKAHKWLKVSQTNVPSVSAGGQVFVPSDTKHLTSVFHFPFDTNEDVCSIQIRETKVPSGLSQSNHY